MNNPYKSKLVRGRLWRHTSASWLLTLLLWVLASAAQTDLSAGTLGVAHITGAGGCRDTADSLHFTFGSGDARGLTYGLFSLVRANYRGRW